MEVRSLDFGLWSLVLGFSANECCVVTRARLFAGELLAASGPPRLR